jgi:hypothetical protein
MASEVPLESEKARAELIRSGLFFAWSSEGLRPGDETASAQEEEPTGRGQAAAIHCGQSATAASSSSPQAH